MSSLSKGLKALLVSLVAAGFVVATATSGSATDEGIIVTQDDKCVTYLTPTSNPAPVGNALAYAYGEPDPVVLPQGQPMVIADDPGTELEVRIVSEDDETIVYFEDTFTVPECTVEEEATPPPSTDPGKKPVDGSKTGDIQQPAGISPLAVVGISVGAAALLALVVAFVARRRGIGASA